MPSVSVIMPCRNYARFLREAVESVLNQTHEDLEVIVVDDGSTDETQAVLQSIADPRLQVLTHNRQQGVSVARNTALNQATGEYIAFLDADDLWRPRYLERQLALLTSEPELGMCFTDFVRSGPDGKLLNRSYLSWTPELGSVRWRVAEDGVGRVILDDAFTTLISFGEHPIQLQTVMVRSGCVNRPWLAPSRSGGKGPLRSRSIGSWARIGGGCIEYGSDPAVSAGPPKCSPK